jgi:hypothetical protein
MVKGTRALRQRAYHAKLRRYAGVSANLWIQNGNSCAQVGRRVVEKLQYTRVPLEGIVHDAALHTEATTVDETDLAQPGGMRVVDVLFHHRRDVAWSERMEVESAFDRNPERVLILHSIEWGLVVRSGR